MGVLEEKRKREEKRKNRNAPSQLRSASTPHDPVENPVPASGDVNTPASMPTAPAVQTPVAPVQETRLANGSPNAMKEPTTSLAPLAGQPDMSIQQQTTPEWVKTGSYEELVKTNPNVSRGQYAYELSKYRREQGQPDLSYAEWANILKGQDPFETEADRQKRERRMKTAKILTGVGSILGNLVNYVRAKNGHVAMNLGNPTEGYNRLERIRQGQEQLARSNAKDYLGMIALDRAEKAKAEAAEAARAQAERNYQMKQVELEWKMKNAKAESDRKKAADDLAALKFAWQKERDKAQMDETKRHNQASEATARERVAKTGSGNQKYLELQTSSGTKKYTPEEYGSNWIHKAYQDMLKESDGKRFAVTKYAGVMGGSSTPSEQEMYDAITRYNESQWKNQFKSSRYGGGETEKPPLE